mgnify:CR=1 FL=1
MVAERSTLQILLSSKDNYMYLETYKVADFTSFHYPQNYIEQILKLLESADLCHIVSFELTGWV